MSLPAGANYWRHVVALTATKMAGRHAQVEQSCRAVLMRSWTAWERQHPGTEYWVAWMVAGKKDFCRVAMCLDGWIAIQCMDGWIAMVRFLYRFGTSKDWQSTGWMSASTIAAHRPGEQLCRLGLPQPRVHTVQAAQARLALRPPHNSNGTSCKHRKPAANTASATLSTGTPKPKAATTPVATTPPVASTLRL
eukprot:s800_g1.t1